MTAKASIGNHIPSPALIQYLHTQAGRLNFFTPNLSSSFSFIDHAPRKSPQRSIITQTLSRRRKAPVNGAETSKITARLINTTASRQATAMESGMFPIEMFSVGSGLRQSKSQFHSTPTTYTDDPRNPENRHRWLKAVWKASKMAKRRGPVSPGADTLSTDMFNLGRTVAGKTSNELKLRCTEFDENGNVVLVNGEFKKSELIAKYGLLPRDLRKIDSSVIPQMLVRDSSILISLLHLRVLIKHNRVLVFDAYGSTDSYTQSLFMYDLEGKLRLRDGSRQAGGLPYELRALEAVLISVTTGLESEFEGVRDPVVRVLRDLEEDIDRDKLRLLLIYSKKLGTFEQKAKLVRNAIDELLDADDDLAAMYLTDKAKGGRRRETDHTEVEMLLETYHKVCDEIVQVSGNLVSNIRNTEEIVKAILDANRNSLMLLDLKFSIGTLGIGSGAFIAALYGMNVKNFIEESSLGFYGVTVTSGIFAAIVCVYGLHKLRKVQRVSMWGESGSGGGGKGQDWVVRGRRGNIEQHGRNWRSLEPGMESGRDERWRTLKGAECKAQSKPPVEAPPLGLKNQQ